MSEVQPRPELKPADRAVAYLLDRLQVDPDLRFYCDPFTESFNQLCLAEAERTGETVERVKERREKVLNPRHRKAEVVMLREELRAAEDAERDVDEAEDAQRQAEARADSMVSLLHEAREMLERVKRGQTIQPYDLNGVIYRIEDRIGRGVPAGRSSFCF